MIGQCCQLLNCFDAVGWLTGWPLKPISKGSVSEQVERENWGGNHLMQIRLENNRVDAVVLYELILLHSFNDTLV